MADSIYGIGFVVSCNGNILTPVPIRYESVHYVMSSECPIYADDLHILFHFGKNLSKFTQMDGEIEDLSNLYNL